MTRWTVHFIWAGLLVSIVALSRAEMSTSSTSANDEKAKPEFPAQMKIGVVDIKQVFMAYKPFNEKMAAMKTKVAAAEAKFGNQQDEIRKLTDQAKNESTPADERAQLEKKVVERQSLMQAEIAIQRREFVHAEGAVYRDVMATLDRQITKYAKENGLHVVLRVSADTPNGNERQEIAAALAKPVCYFDPKLDITSEIIKAMKED